MGLVQRAAVVAGTGGPATALLDARRGGRQHGSGRHQLLQSAVEHPADLRRVARDTHRGAPGTSGKMIFAHPAFRGVGLTSSSIKAPSNALPRRRTLWT